VDVGLCIASKIDDMDYVVRAEALGYSHAWFADSQMIWSDAYACLAIAATRTSRIRLGTGVSVVGTRIAPVTAAAIASINRIAPGRTFLAIGNGNTAWRLMGHTPMLLAEFEEYVRVVRSLLDGAETDFTSRGHTTKIRFDVAELGYLDLDHFIPIYVSGFGPRAQALAGKYGDGLVTAIPNQPAFFEQVWANVVKGADEVGRTVSKDDFPTCSLTAACVLRPGEDLTSERVMDTLGSIVIAGFHYAYDNVRNYGLEPPAHLADSWDEYSDMVEAVPEAQRHRKIHVGHCMWLEPEERKFVTPERIQASCLVGSGPEIVEQLEAMERAGLTQVMLLPSLEKQYEALEDVSREVLSRL
jgi:alkanesulfonate monooxygenase SsuD/methylene tetrahydromethanopterin reductase-like flavin-dependent oxidoreductase (luciferase family)